MSPDKLDNKVKDSLQNLEVPFDPSGWDRLERSLDAKVSTSSFKWKWKYSLNAFVGLAAGTALTWYVLSDNNTQVSQDKTIPVTKSEVVKMDNPITPVTTINAPENTGAETGTMPSPSPVYYATWPTNTGSGSLNSNVTSPDDGNASNSEFPQELKDRPLIQNPLMRGQNLVANPLDYDNYTKRNGANMLSPDELSIFTSPEYLANQKTFFFGDQIDEKKGYIYNTKEKDSMRRLFILKQQEEEELKRQEELEKVTPPDTITVKSPMVPNDNPPKKKKDKKSNKGSKKDDKVNSEPSSDKESTVENPEEDKKKEDLKKKRDDKPKIDGRKSDPLNPYQN